MPTIEIYVDNETHIKFLQKSDAERTRIRKAAQIKLKEEIYQTTQKTATTALNGLSAANKAGDKGEPGQSN